MAWDVVVLNESSQQFIECPSIHNLFNGEERFRENWNRTEVRWHFGDGGVALLKMQTCPVHMCGEISSQHLKLFSPLKPSYILGIYFDHFVMEI